jgi:hypothetical protein
MGLPFSGNGTPIDFSDIQTTFGGANPISMSEYYRGGAYVTDNNVNVPTNEFTITSVSWSASVAIIGISGSTVIPIGTSVVIAGMTPSGYNGTYTVTVSSAGTFRYALATDPNIANVFTITSASWLASVVTIVISGATVITVGTSVIVAGMTPSGYNGTYTVTVSSAGTFRYALATNPGVATVFGTATRSTVFGTATTATGTFPIAVGNFYGASKQFSFAISANTADIYADSAYLTAKGWDGASYFQMTINAGIYVYSTSAPAAGPPNDALLIKGSFPYGFGVVNNGYILGKGGAGGYATSGSTTNLAGRQGGPALGISNTFTTATMSVINNSGAYIAGGGGGGAGMRNSGGEIWGGGGGGAGGGSGGQAYQSRGGFTLGSPGGGGAVGVAGGNGSGNGASGGGGGGAGGGGGGYVLDGISSTRNGGGSGGGGGRILPGTGGANGNSAADGGAGNAVGGSISSGGDNVGAAGGGGWGAAGGNFSSSQGTVSGGAGGAAIDKNGSTVTVTNSGTIYGSTLA